MSLSNYTAGEALPPKPFEKIQDEMHRLATTAAVVGEELITGGLLILAAAKNAKCVQVTNIEP